VIRTIRGLQDTVFLTFDDGPDEHFTPEVLRVLKTHKAQATFFVIADKLKNNRRQLEEIQAAGHAIGNHSLDHRYRHFFAGKRRLEHWIDDAEAEMRRMGVQEWVGFRPPAGILTPPLLRVLRERGEPLVLWNERFYDAVIPWTERRALRSARNIQPGSIVLLHDRQKSRRRNSFLQTLDRYIAELKSRGLRSRALTRELCLRS
jgi:peptidoglycan-N-acetylglucosamine deacetylase